MDRPNVLLIVIDDLNDWVRCMGGHPQAKTPNIDRLAESGVLFTNAHAQATICEPSRVSFLTGVRPSSSGVYRFLRCNKHDTKCAFRTSPVLQAAETIPECFSRNGYTTFGAGKVFHAGDEAQYFDRTIDADFENDYACRFGKPSEFPKAPLDSFGIGPLYHAYDVGAWPTEDSGLPDTRNINWAVDSLKQNHDQPFFLAAGLSKPHLPWLVPKKWWDLYPDEGNIVLAPIKDDDRYDLPEFARMATWTYPDPDRFRELMPDSKLRKLVKGYLTCVSYMDHQVGRLMTALEESPNTENTVVVFLSDQGHEFGQKGRINKYSLWEVSTRVPVIIRAPGLPQGARCNQPVELLDVYSTLLDLVHLRNYESSEQLEGTSLLPQLEQPDAKRDQPAITTFYYQSHSVRSESWRYIRYADGTEELYDHRSDPHEWHNLAADQQYNGIIREHQRFLPEKNELPLEGSYYPWYTEEETRRIDQLSGI